MSESITKHLMIAARHSQLCIGSRLKKYGITAAEEPFFMAALHHSGAIQEELTGLVGVDKAATTRAIISLEEKGYLMRQRDEKDRRQKRIYPTEKALHLEERVHGELLAINEELLSGISGEERRLMLRLLLKMEENLRKIKEKERGEST